jgi:type I phosphodiesterase/nucleotide pyrophosphatase
MSSLWANLKKKENWPVVLIPLALLLWAQFGAPNLGRATFNSLSYYNSPYQGNSALVKPIQPGEAGQPVVKKVVLIVVDALRDDTSRQLDTLNGLRAQGAGRVSVVGQPSFSLPGWTVIGAGAWQEQSGFTTNFPERHLDIDTLFLAAKRAGLTTAMSGTPEWFQLYNVGVDDVEMRQDPTESNEDHYKNMDAALAFDRELGAAGLKALESDPDFALLYFTGVDIAGHGYGGASEQYRQAAQATDEMIADFLEQIDLSTTTVIVTSDHGMIDSNWDGGGGHGGWEDIVLRSPLIAAGAGIKPGDYPDAKQADIAPTIAALLGLSIPAHNQGVILTDMLDAPDDVKAARMVDNAQEIAVRYQQMHDAIGTDQTVDTALIDEAKAALKSGDTSSALDKTSASITATRAQWEAARNTKLGSERFLRLLLALYLLLPLALYGYWWAKAGWHGLAPLVCGALYLIANPVLYLVVRGFRYSITMFNTEVYILPFLTARVIDALILLIVVTLVLAVWRRNAGAGGLARDTANMLFVIGTGVIVQILVFYVLWNVEYSWALPDTALGFKYYIDVFQSTAFWPQLPLPVAAILPLLAIGIGWVAKRVAGLVSR